MGDKNPKSKEKNQKQKDVGKAADAKKVQMAKDAKVAVANRTKK